MANPGLIDLTENQEAALQRRKSLGYTVIRVWTTKGGYVRVDMLNFETNATKALYWYKNEWRVAH